MNISHCISQVRDRRLALFDTPRIPKPPWNIHLEVCQSGLLHRHRVTMDTVVFQKRRYRQENQIQTLQKLHQILQILQSQIQNQN